MTKIYEKNPRPCVIRNTFCQSYRQIPVGFSSWWRVAQKARSELHRHYLSSASRSRNESSTLQYSTIVPPFQKDLSRWNILEPQGYSCPELNLWAIDEKHSICLLHHFKRNSRRILERRCTKRVHYLCCQKLRGIFAYFSIRSPAIRRRLLHI